MGPSGLGRSLLRTATPKKRGWLGRPCSRTGVIGLPTDSVPWVRLHSRWGRADLGGGAELRERRRRSAAGGLWPQG